MLRPEESPQSTDPRGSTAWIDNRASLCGVVRNLVGFEKVGQLCNWVASVEIESDVGLVELVGEVDEEHGTEDITRGQVPLAHARVVRLVEPFLGHLVEIRPAQPRPVALPQGPFDLNRENSIEAG